jgi:hypothetical protein
VTVTQVNIRAAWWSSSVSGVVGASGLAIVEVELWSTAQQLQDGTVGSKGSRGVGSCSRIRQSLIKSHHRGASTMDRTLKLLSKEAGDSP